MNTTQYKADLLAIENALIEFMRTHHRPATQDLDLLYATESVLESDILATPEGSTRWTLLESLVERDWEPSDWVDEQHVHAIYDGVVEALTEFGIASWEE